MKDFFKGKFATSLVVIATVILAGVAIFTALRLYQLGQQPVAPNAPGSQPFAWDCSGYTFAVSSNGTVTLQNNSSKDEASQQAKVYINGNLVSTLDVPALPKGQSATLGTVQVPDGGFSWQVNGTKDCSNSGTSVVACKLLTFTLSGPTPTLTVTPIPELTSTLTPTTEPGSTSTPTPTEQPLGGVSPTPNPPPSMPGAPNCDSAKPDAPILTSVKKNGTEAVLTWTSVNLADHYVIAYGTSSNNLQYGVPDTGNVTTYTIRSLGANTTYYFTVYAVNNCMPSDGAKIVSSVAGTSIATTELPATGVSFPTVISLVGGIAFIVLAITLAI